MRDIETLTSRQKGDRAERQLVHFLQAAGFAGERVPLSGAAGGSFRGDVTPVECKVRGHGFNQLYAWLDGNDFLVVKGDRRDMLVVLPPRLAIEIATAAEARKLDPPRGG